MNVYEEDQEGFQRVEENKVLTDQTVQDRTNETIELQTRVDIDYECGVAYGLGFLLEHLNLVTEASFLSRVEQFVHWFKTSNHRPVSYMEEILFMKGFITTIRSISRTRVDLATCREVFKREILWLKSRIKVECVPWWVCKFISVEHDLFVLNDFKLNPTMTSTMASPFTNSIELMKPKEYSLNLKALKATPTIATPTKATPTKATNKIPKATNILQLLEEREFE